jgi:predicted Fe-S protein YdhL (DUF1289 family)
MESEEKLPVESPCIGVCELDKAEDRCTGCHRTVSELTHWARMTDAEKLGVLAKVAERREDRGHA